MATVYAPLVGGDLIHRIEMNIVMNIIILFIHGVDIGIAKISMKLIGPLGTELRHILSTYIMCPCDLDH